MCLCNFVTSRICMFVPFRSTVRPPPPLPPPPSSSAPALPPSIPFPTASYTPLIRVAIEHVAECHLLVDARAGGARMVTLDKH